MNIANSLTGLTETIVVASAELGNVLAGLTDTTVVARVDLGDLLAGLAKASAANGLLSLGSVCTGV